MGAKAMIGAVSVLSIATVAWGPSRAQEREASGAPKPSAAKSGAPAESVARLAEELRRHPVRPRRVPAQPQPAPVRFVIRLMDLASEEVTLIADHPAPTLTYCGSPAWSHDGRRILYDATPSTQWTLSRLESIDLIGGRLTVTELGTGNCPTFSPADDRIAFLSNADGVQNGVWMMNADGTGRRYLGDYGIPEWSPDGRRMMVITFTEPRQVTIMDADAEKSGILRIDGDSMVRSVPKWAGAGTIVVVMAADDGDQVALIDVTTTTRARVKEVLWRQSSGPNVKPSHPVYRALQV